MQRNKRAFVRRPASLDQIRRVAEEKLAEAARRAASAYELALQRDHDARQAVDALEASIDPRRDRRGSAAIRALEGAERAAQLAYVERSNAEEALVSTIIALDPDAPSTRIVGATCYRFKPRGLLIGSRLYTVVPTDPTDFHPLDPRDESQVSEKGCWSVCVIPLDLDQILSVPAESEGEPQ